MQASRDLLRTKEEAAADRIGVRGSSPGLRHMPCFRVGTIRGRPYDAIFRRLVREFCIASNVGSLTFRWIGPVEYQSLPFGLNGSGHRSE